MAKRRVERRGQALIRGTRKVRPMFDLAKARSELLAKSMVEIERATALAWGGRAAASYGLCLEERDSYASLQRFWEGENYRQEALEHAAMVEDDAFMDGIRHEIEEPRAKAKKTLMPRPLETPRRR